MITHKDRKCVRDEKSPVRIEICRDKTSNNWPLRNWSSFEFFLYTKTARTTKRVVLHIATGHTPNGNPIWRHPYFGSPHKNKVRFLWNKEAVLYNSNKYLIVGHYGRIFFGTALWHYLDFLMGVNPAIMPSNSVFIPTIMFGDWHMTILFRFLKNCQYFTVKQLILAGM